MGFDLQPTEEQQALVSMLRSFATDVLRPRARAAEEAGATPDDLVAQIWELGVTTFADEAYGGGGALDAMTYCLAVEELAWGDPGIAADAVGAGLGAIVLGLAGTEEQKARLLPPLSEAPAAAFLALGERDAAGSVADLETAVDSDKVSGTKYGVARAAEAAFGIVVGRDEAGPAAVIVEGDLDIVRREKKLGLQAAPTDVVAFDIAGEALASGAALDRALMWTKLATGAIAVGCARAGLEYASTYATEREAFGKPIGAFQAISFKIADMATAVDAARLALWHAAWRLDRDEASLDGVTAAVAQALSAAVVCGDDGVQVLGGHGYVKDHPVEKWFRDAVTLSVFDAPELLGDALVGAALFTGGAR